MLDQLLKDLERDEGWRESPYRDHLGYLTIGFGFLIDERKPCKLPKLAGRYWLRCIVNDRICDLTERWPWFQTQPESVRRALVNMSYQLGVSGVLNFRCMLAALQIGDRKAAAHHALDSKWARQTPERAKRISDLIRGDS